MIKSDARYIHQEKDHNLNEPEQLVPLFLEFFDPQTVCDIGCGTGNFLNVFKKRGKEVYGFDGPWANRDLLYKYINKDEFEEIDFEANFPKMDQKFDLALCLEVAEHISPKKADAFVAFLCSVTDNLIFSAAIPFQGGDNHINEQWESYWEDKFNQWNFKKYDIIRHRIWNNKNVQWWYRQNLVVYSKNDLSRFPAVSFENAIIRECYEQKTALLSNFSGIVMVTPSLKKYLGSLIRKTFGERVYYAIKQRRL